MKKILIFCLIVCSLSRLEAQEQGVQFQELTFQEALNKAKAENKLVLWIATPVGVAPVNIC